MTTTTRPGTTAGPTPVTASPTRAAFDVTDLPYRTVVGYAASLDRDVYFESYANRTLLIAE